MVSKFTQWPTKKKHLLEFCQMTRLLKGGNLTMKKLMTDCAIPVATDVACAKAFDENAEAVVKHVSEVQDDDMIFA